MCDFVHYIISFLYNTKWKQNQLDKYNQVMEKIGDYSFFNKDDMDYLHTLPKENLIQMIQIYNSVYTDNIISLLAYNEKQNQTK
jgi:hypothetical protein